MDVAGDLINLAIAVFTAAAAGAAWVSARASLKAIEQANKQAEESRKFAEESRKISEQQAEAMLTAAKANALASRISFYAEQIRFIEKQFEDYQYRGRAIELNAGDKLKQLKAEQQHLAYWLDRQTDVLGVGLGNECPGSPYNDRINGAADAS